MTAMLFTPFSINLFQLLVIVLFVGAVCTVIGMMWGGRCRDDQDALHYGVNDVQGAARDGRLERRSRPRTVTAYDPRAQSTRQRSVRT